MSVFSALDYDDHEEVVFIRDAASGLRAIIAIHDTTLGPSLGGCRMYPYASEEDALRDVLRLSRGMTYKAAVAGVALGGGKSVIIGDPKQNKSEALLQAMGRAIDGLGGRYIVGEDIGTNPDDMKAMRRETKAVSCLLEEDGGYGDPAPFTALGAFQAIRAGLLFQRNVDSVSGVTVAVQGVGNVGLNLCKLLVDAGANVIACDPDHGRRQAASQLGARIVGLDEIYGAEAEVFAPCATGSILNDRTIPLLRATIVAGAANNQLEETRHADTLKARGVAYVPDYVANGGGLISCAAEWYKTSHSAIRPAVLKIFDTCLMILREASTKGITTSEAADGIARQRLKENAPPVAAGGA
jgi:leucine dehydrogenase